MRGSLSIIRNGLTLLIVCIPLAVVTTITLMPAWRGLEARFGVEAVGHSGPAGWCYWVVYVVWVSLLAWGWSWRRHRRKAEPASKPPA